MSRSLFVVHVPELGMWTFLSGDAGAADSTPDASFELNTATIPLLHFSIDLQTTANISNPRCLPYLSTPENLTILTKVRYDIARPVS